MTAFFTCLYTKAQAKQILANWGVKDVPSKGTKIVIAPPGKEWIEVEWAEKKSEYGQRLFCISQYRN